MPDRLRLSTLQVIAVSNHASPSKRKLPSCISPVHTSPAFRKKLKRNKSLETVIAVMEDGSAESWYQQLDIASQAEIISDVKNCLPG